MFPLLAILFLVVPIVELYVIVQVAQGVGVLETIGLLILISLVGAWLVRAEGMGVIRRIQQKLGTGQMPGKEMVDGGLILFAGALMLTPGFVTDALGVALLLPPTRAMVRGVLMRRFKGSVTVLGGPGAAGGAAFGFGRGPFIDVDGTDGPPNRANRDIVDLTREDDEPPRQPPSLDA